MRRTVRLAREAGVAVGAHPGFPDLRASAAARCGGRRGGRGHWCSTRSAPLRRSRAPKGSSLRTSRRTARSTTWRRATRALADAIARAIRAFDPALVLFGLPGSELLRAGRDAGLAVASEGFADRTYEPDGSLTPRSRPGSVIHDPEAVVARALRIVTERA